MVETVTITNPAAKSGLTIINKADFDPKRHKLADAPETITRESIAKMKKADVLDLLAAHGVEGDGSLADLRKALTDIMFLG